MVQRILVIGASGQLGAALLPRLLAGGFDIFALSRASRTAQAGVHWLRGSLEAMPSLPHGLDVVVSVGPLDAFARWIASTPIPRARIIAIGSTGIRDKRQSPDPLEQALARRLEESEALLWRSAKLDSHLLTLLRPTLLYSGAGDASLERITSAARRWRFLPVPTNARGLRQPVHVDDVAAAIEACLAAPATSGATYELPGGETLEFRELVRRTLAARCPGARVVPVPAALFRIGLALVLAWRGNRGGGGWLSRLSQDQTADIGPAQQGFGYTARVFDP